MNLDNIKVGDVFKNYPELCKALGLEVKKGDSKRVQLEWIRKHIDILQNGRNFIIKNIIKKEIEIYPSKGGSNNKIEYKKNLEKLILDILAQPKNKGKIFLSKNKFFYSLEMVNINYLDTKQRVPKLSKHLDIDESIIHEWMDTTGGVLERSLETALTSLRNKSLIFWSKEITICKLEEIDSSEVIIPITKIDAYGEEDIKYITQKNTKKIIREATDDEKKIIIRIEREALDRLDCFDKRDAVQKGLWGEFKRMTDYRLRNEHMILYNYQSYKILSNPDHIEEFQKKYYLNTDERIEEKIATNRLVKDRLENNLNSRYTNAIKEMEENNIIFYQSDKIQMRTSDNYISNNIILNDTLIDRDAKDIRKNVKETSLL